MVEWLQPWLAASCANACLHEPDTLSAFFCRQARWAWLDPAGTITASGVLDGAPTAAHGPGRPAQGVRLSRAGTDRVVARWTLLPGRGDDRQAAGGVALITRHGPRFVRTATSAAHTTFAIDGWGDEPVVAAAGAVAVVKVAARPVGGGPDIPLSPPTPVPVGGLRPNQAKAVTVAVPFPADLPAGQYQLVAVVTGLADEQVPVEQFFATFDWDGPGPDAALLSAEDFLSALES